MTPLVTVLLLAAQPTPDPQQAPPEAPSVATDEAQYMSSALGPSKGRWLLGVELGVSGTGGIALPTLGVRVEYGLHDRLDFRFAINSVFVYTHGDAGFGISLARWSTLSLGLRLGVSADVWTNRESEFLWSGTPGLVLTTQGGWGAFSAVLDAPLYFEGVESLWDANAEPLFTVGIRPGAVLELGDGSGLAPYFRVDISILANARGFDRVVSQGAVGLRF